MLMHALYKLLRPRYGTGKVSRGSGIINVYMADSFVTKLFGLMYRDKLEKDMGMLFTLRDESKIGASIWMLNMRFGIDIIWLNAKKQVVDIKEDARPCKSFFNCRTYTPSAKAKYVLELNRGIVRQLGIRRGERMEFDSR